MPVPRFFSPAPLPAAGEGEGRLFPLDKRVAHHALTVLRLREKDPLCLFDGQGGQWQARLEKEEGQGAALKARLQQHESGVAPSPLNCVLVQALAVGDKMDWIIQKAVELGVSAIQPVHTQRCVQKVVGTRAERKHEHWQQIAVSACEQSGRCDVPAVYPVCAFSAFLATCPPESLWMLAPGGQKRLPAALPSGQLHVLIGPEGGWTDEEHAQAQRHGACLIGLGPRVLRTETAGLAFISVLQSRFGDFFE
jgi:16S rRNA (uracil1498-N3)-methyltransferase